MGILRVTGVEGPPETKKCPKSVHGTLFASGAAKNRKKSGQNSPTGRSVSNRPHKSVHLDTFWTQFGLRSVVYLTRVRARVSWSSLTSERGWHINLCILRFTSCTPMVVLAREPQGIVSGQPALEPCVHRSFRRSWCFRLCTPLACRQEAWYFSFKHAIITML